MYKVLDLRENIFNKDFELMLDFCFGYASYISFTKRNCKLTKNDVYAYNEFFDAMKGFHIKDINVKHWYRYYVPENKNLKIYLYKADKKIKNIILNNTNNLFLRKYNSFSIWNWPEDLCFFHNEKLFLGTVSHEQLGTAYLESKNMLDELIKIGNWDEKEIDFLKEERIIL